MAWSLPWAQWHLRQRWRDDCAVSHHRRQAHALVAQIVAAVIGAVFVIGLQITAIFSAGNLSGLAALQSDWMLRHVPDSGSAFWWPARAVLGDYTVLVAGFASGIAALELAIAIFSRRFGEHAIAAAGSPAPLCGSADGCMHSAGGLPGARCGTRNGRFCSATLGWSRRR